MEEKPCTIQPHVGNHTEYTQNRVLIVVLVIVPPADRGCIAPVLDKLPESTVVVVVL